MQLGYLSEALVYLLVKFLQEFRDVPRPYDAAQVRRSRVDTLCKKQVRCVVVQSWKKVQHSSRRLKLFFVEVSPEGVAPHRCLPAERNRAAQYLDAILSHHGAVKLAS